MHWQEIASRLAQLKKTRSTVFYSYMLISYIVSAIVIRFYSMSLDLSPELGYDFLNYAALVFFAYLFEYLTRSFDFPPTNLNKTDLDAINFLLLPYKLFLLSFVFGILILFVNELFFPFGLNFSWKMLFFGYVLTCVQVTANLLFLKSIK